MNLLLKKLFYPLFFIIFLFSFFLIEGDYKFYLFGIWSVFLLVFSQVFTEKKHFLSGSIVLAFILSTSFLISTIFSKHIPLSIETLLFYLLSLAMFIFFATLSKKIFNQKLFLYCLSVITLILNIFVLFFTFFNFKEMSFPGMNLLTRNYGHNHYVAFLILMMPIFWWQLMFSSEEEWASKKLIKSLSIILLIFSYFIIIVSLARLAIVVFLLQLALILFINKKLFPNLSGKKLVVSIGKVLISIFLLICTLYFAMPFLTTNQENGISCVSIFKKKELCQPFTENIRFSYWQTAWSIFKENPVFGSGLKTFNFSSRHFPSKGFQGTSYAHNIFLHNLAEGGLVGGGVFIIFIIYLFSKTFLLIKNQKNPLYNFLWISAFSSFLNALFDFDWHFFIIFALTLIFLAIILQNDGLDKEKYLKKIGLNIYLLIIALVAVFFSFACLNAEIWRKSGRENLIIEKTPYFNGQINHLISDQQLTANNKKLSIQDFESLWPLYKNDPNYISQYLKIEEISKEKRFTLLMKLADLDHLAFLSLYSLSEPIDNLGFATKLAEKKVKIVEKKGLLSNHEILTYTEDKRRKDAKELVLLADKFYEEMDYDTSSYFYNKAYEFYPKIYNNKKLMFFYEKEAIVTQMLLRLNLKTDDFEIYGYDYDMQFVNAISEAWRKNDLKLAISLTKMLPSGYQYHYLIFQNILQITIGSKDENQKIKKQNLESYIQEFKERKEWSSLDLGLLLQKN